MDTPDGVRLMMWKGEVREGRVPAFRPWILVANAVRDAPVPYPPFSQANHDRLSSGYRFLWIRCVNFSRRKYQGVTTMPIYALDGVAPEIAAEGLLDRARCGADRQSAAAEDASVWFGAVLRGDNEWITIGENSNIQDNSVIHADPGQPVAIGAASPSAIASLCIRAEVGDGSLIGMGAILLNRARIGSRSPGGRQCAGDRRQAVSRTAR